MKKSIYAKPIINIVEYKNDDIITSSGLMASLNNANTEQEIETPINTSGMLGFKTK